MYVLARHMLLIMGFTVYSFSNLNEWKDVHNMQDIIELNLLNLSKYVDFNVNWAWRRGDSANVGPALV